MTVTSTRKTTTTDERERVVAEAVHSAAMEGLTVRPATRADADEYARGSIDVDELLARVDARHRVA